MGKSDRKMGKLNEVISDVDYKHPIERLTTRLSIRTVNKAIGEHSEDTHKHRLTKNIVEMLISYIPSHEFRRYSSHCLPVAVMYSNHYIIKKMFERGLRSANTWSLFVALWKGDEEMAKILAGNVGYILHAEDLISFKLATYRSGNRIKIGDIFYREEIDNFKINNVKNDSYMEKVISRQRELNKRAYETFIRKSNVSYSHIKTCDCPRSSLDAIADDIIILERFAMECEDKLDRLLQYVRIYGILKWGYIEYGGHKQVARYYEKVPVP